MRGYNYWMCKMFDANKNGYVTFGDVLERVLSYAIGIGGGLIILFLMYEGVLGFLESGFGTSSDTPDDIMVIRQLGKALLIFIAFLLFIGTVLFASDIKIAECKLKEEEKK